jgi:Ca2+-binding EF-hand superfamily protein
MRNTLAFSSTLFLCAMGAFAAQPPGIPGFQPGARRGPGGPPSVILRALDTNHDNALSADEIAAAPKTLLTLDKNADGTLSADELQFRREAGPGAPERAEAGRAAEPDESTPSPDDLVKQLMSFDKNGDGLLTPDEIPDRLQNLFTRADADHNGKLTPAELRTLAVTQTPPPPPPEHGPGGFRDPLTAALDIDHDGILSAAEIAAAPASLLMLDTNHDGHLSPDELRPRPPAGRGFGEVERPLQPPSASSTPQTNP